MGVVMIRLAHPPCSGCGVPATFQLESIPGYLCFACAKDVMQFMIRNECWNNPVGADIGISIAECKNNKGAYRVWIRSVHGGGAYSDHYLKFDSEISS